MEGGPGFCDCATANPDPMRSHQFLQQTHQELVIFDTSQAYPTSSLVVQEKQRLSASFFSCLWSRKVCQGASCNARPSIASGSLTGYGEIHVELALALLLLFWPVDKRARCFALRCLFRLSWSISFVGPFSHISQSRQ